MAQNTTSNRGYDDTVYIPRQQRLRPMILTRKVQQFYLVYLCFPDGSEVQMDADTRIQVLFDERVRHLTLLRGRAIFDVRHDPQRPFVVDADRRLYDAKRWQLEGE